MSTGRISTKINLAALKNATILKMGKNKDVECIIIPIAQNHLFRSEKGAVYLDMVGFPLKEKKADSKDTHLVSQSFSKEVREKQTEEDKKANKILGNHIVWDEQGGGGHTEAAATTAATEDDLPF